jgi:hypothetical protein
VSIYIAMAVVSQNIVLVSDLKEVKVDEPHLQIRSDL